MWRSFRLVVPKNKTLLHTARFKRFYSTSSSSSGGSKILLGLIAATGAGFAGAVVYGKYDKKFKNLLEENIPYIRFIYEWLPEDKKPVLPKEGPLTEGKTKDSAIASGLLKKKLDREKATVTESTKPPTHSKSTTAQPSDIKNDESIVKKSETKLSEQNEIWNETAVEHAFKETMVLDTIRKLEKSSEEAVNAHKFAVNAIKSHTAKLYDALDLPENKDGDIVWKEANKASMDKSKALKQAKHKASETRAILDKLKTDIKKVSETDINSYLVRAGEESIARVQQDLQLAETEVATVESEAKTAAEYEQLVTASKEQFRKELQIVLPNYLHSDKDKTITEGDLNLLIAHAHRRIEQLQKQLAKQQVTEKLRVDEALRLQKVQTDKLVETKVEAEMERKNLDLELAVSNRTAALKENFEGELRQQLRRQAAAHADHIQEVLKVQEQELERKYSLEVEEKLLHQKGVFISEVSGSMARLKGILSFLKAKSEFDKASKKAQALWLACQAMNQKVTVDKSGILSPLSTDIAAIKIAADDEDSGFINSVLAIIPSEAVNRGVFTHEILKQRFQKVKEVCRKVAMIDENNDSLYRYFLSYLQSFLIVDASSIPKEELDGKVAVDPSEWDTFDVLYRVSHCLSIDDLEQALRYANQLKGEPRVVAKDWINEVRLLLETQLAVRALLAHAAAVGVQAYH